MSDYPNETVQDAANKLMAALALHESSRGTVESALADMWDAGSENTAAQALGPARLIHADASALVDRRAVLARTCHHRILANTEQLLTLLGEKNGTDETTPAAVDPDLIRNLRAATAHARDLRDAPGTSLEDRAQYQAWIKRAHTAEDAADATAIRALLAQPYIQDGGQ